MRPRDETGKLLRVVCDDTNCDGVLELDIRFGEPYWICNGLTHDTPHSPLRACDRSFSANYAALPRADGGGK